MNPVRKQNVDKVRLWLRHWEEDGFFSPEVEALIVSLEKVRGDDYNETVFQWAGVSRSQWTKLYNLVFPRIKP